MGKLIFDYLGKRNKLEFLQLQLYYYMQKVASAGMGNPKERKECPICGKTLYDRSTWNRHMRIHTGRFLNIQRHIVLPTKLS